MQRLIRIGWGCDGALALKVILLARNRVISSVIHGENEIKTSSSIISILGETITSKNQKRFFGWIGSILIFLIIPVKLSRFFDLSILHEITDNSPSFLGSSGLFFLFLSSKYKLLNTKIYQIALLTLIISFSIEFIQLIPRPGILSHVFYIFDKTDLIASLLGIVLSLIFTALILLLTDLHG